MSYDWPAELISECRDDDQRDGLSPWARVSQQRWTSRVRREGARIAEAGARAENRRLRKLGKHIPAGCPFCNEDEEPPPSGTRIRWRAEAAPESERRPRKKHPALRLV